MYIIKCYAVILMSKVIEREFWYLYSVHAFFDTCVNFILLYACKKIKFWELISLGDVYLANQRGKFQAVIRLSKNAVAHYGGARICVVYSSSLSVTRWMQCISSSTVVLLTNRALKYITAPSSFPLLFCCLCFSSKRDLAGAMDMALPFLVQQEE